MKYLRLTGLKSFFSPYTYSVLVSLNQIAKTTDADSVALLALRIPRYDTGIVECPFVDIGGSVFDIDLTVPAAQALVGGDVNFSTATRLLSPLTLGNVAAWYDASAPLHKASYAGECAAGDAVGIWPDQATGSTAAPGGGTPTLAVNADGYRGVQFSGNSYMESAANVFVAGMEQEYHVFFVTTANAGMSALSTRYTWATNPVTIFGGVSGTGVSRQYVTGWATTTGMTLYNGLVDSFSDVFSAGVDGTVGRMRAGIRPAGGQSSSTTVLEVTVAASATSFSTPAKLRIGTANGTGDAFDGMIHEVIVFSRGLTAEEVRQVHEYLAVKWGKAQNFLLMAGNSLTSGTGSTTGANQVISAAGDNGPGYMKAALGSTWLVGVDSTPGRTDAQILTGSPTYGQTLGARGTNKLVLSYWEGTNTLTTDKTMMAAAERMRTTCRAFRAAGWRVVINTVLPRQAAGLYAGFEPDRLALNAWIRTNYRTFADAICDVGASPTLADPTNLTYYNADKIHLTSLGYQVWAGMLLPAVLSV